MVQGTLDGVLQGIAGELSRYDGDKVKLVYSDPPVSYDNQVRGDPNNHYDTMTDAQLLDLPVRRILADDAILFMWATWPRVADGLAWNIIRSWGFRALTCGFIWIKTNAGNGRPSFGLGNWTRGNSEPCLIGVRGSPERVARDVSQIIETPEPFTVYSDRRAHSAKPPEVRDAILKICGDVPRVEMFHRGVPIPGWVCMGDGVVRGVPA